MANTRGWLIDKSALARLRRRTKLSSGDFPDNLSAAIVCYLTNYPSSNLAEFQAKFSTSETHDDVQRLLVETQHIQPAWEGHSLAQIGQQVQEILRQRHPHLNDAALAKLANYFTYLNK